MRPRLLALSIIFIAAAVILASMIGCATSGYNWNTCQLEVERAMEILPASMWKRVLIFQVRGSDVEHYVVAYDVPRSGYFRIWDNGGSVVIRGASRHLDPLKIARMYWGQVGLNQQEIISARWEAGGKVGFE